MNPWWLLILLAVFLIGVTKSGFGSGVGLMIVPMTVVGMGHTAYTSAAALGVMLPLLLLGDLVAVAQHRRHFDASVIRRLAPGTAAGVLLGGLALWWFHKQQALLVPLIKLEVGLESVVLVGLHWWRVWRGRHLHVTPSPAKYAVTGTFAGASSTLAHAAGPIIALFLLPQKLDRRVFVGTCAIYFCLLNAAKLPAYAGTQMFDAPRLTLSLSLAPAVLAGAGFGFWVNKRMSDRIFSRVVYAATFSLGWYLIADAGRELVGKV
ncbi:MAG TPA: sulfite exporter TauE/SafE family protein [Humisphaera sp.]